MGEETKIEWATHTFNPWWGCTRVSEACRHCYAESFSKRTGNNVWGPSAPRRFFGEKHWSEPLKWNRKAAEASERHRVFCASMADIGEVLPHGHPDREAMAQARLDLRHLIEATPNLDWLLLTKRPADEALSFLGPKPPSNVWAGSTVESSSEVWRIDHLLRVDVGVRFLSCEPLLGPLDLRGKLEGISWVICGGESGPGARPMHPAWARSLRNQCGEAGVPFFFKQWGDWLPIDQPWKQDDHARLGSRERWLNVAGGHGFHGDEVWRMRRAGKKAAGRELDGQTWDELPEVA